MNQQAKINLREIYENILNRYYRGYFVNVAVVTGNEVLMQRKHVFYSAKIVRKLTGKNPKMLEKWIEWSKK